MSNGKQCEQGDEQGEQGKQGEQGEEQSEQGGGPEEERVVSGELRVTC